MGGVYYSNFFKYFLLINYYGSIKLVYVFYQQINLCATEHRNYLLIVHMIL